MASVVHFTAHGFVANDAIYFSDLVGGDGIIPGLQYFVLAAGLTADDFQFSDTAGGAPFVMGADITSGQVDPWPTYAVLNDGNMTPPATPPTPTAPTVTSALVSGVVRLITTLLDTAEIKVRVWEVQITSKFVSGVGDWTSPSVFNLPENTTTLSLPALGSTVYAVRVRAVDVYGNFGAFSTEVSHTTLAGADALNASQADVANDIPDGLITALKLGDNAVEARHVSANSIGANALAATIILTSLLKTANSGRRVELDGTGIRLLDTDGSLLVNIPTNGDPVYIKGQVNADSLISQTAAEFRGSVSLATAGVMTLQNGINNPSNQPGASASVDSLALTSTPPNLGAGIGYDSGAGTFWLAADPTVSNYVAHEYNATTGALVRSITKTGSFSTIVATLGASSHVSDTAQATSGGTSSQVATPMTIPGGLTNVRITKVSVYMAGYGGSCNVKNAVWTAGNNLLRTSAAYTAPTQALGTGNSSHYDKALSSELPVAAGTGLRVGFLRTSTADGFQWDRDDGSGKTTYIGDGEDGNLTSVSTDSTHKPNVYITYKYDVDTTVETGKMIGVCTDGSYIYTLDANGQLYKYDRTTLAFVASVSIAASITGTKSQAGLFYAATDNVLYVTTTTGTGAGVYPKFISVSTSTLVAGTIYSAAAGSTFSGTTDTFRGGARLADPLNGGSIGYWVATTSAVYEYTLAGTTATQVSSRDFGVAATVGGGVTHDGTQFRGFALATPTTIWKFTNWDWTSASAIYWLTYTWYDSNATGGTHETGVGPRASITLRRRERLLTWNAGIPVGGVDDPNNVRLYMLPNATDPGTGASYKLQVTDALTARYLTDYASGGAANPASNNFAAGVAAELKSNTLGWSLKGDGSIILPKDLWIATNDGAARLYGANADRTYFGSKNGYEWRSALDANIGVLTNKGSWQTGSATFPTSPASADLYYRTDIGMWFRYDGTRWLCTCAHTLQFLSDGAQPVSAFSAYRGAIPRHLGTSDTYIRELHTSFFVNGGTALSGSHKWVGVGSGWTSNPTITVAAGASTVWRADDQTLNQLGGTGLGSAFQLEIDWTKTGTPGNLYALSDILFHYVAT